MAEINTEKQTKKRTKGKKLSTRIDLTPMVDLGFLLITFFIFTTSLSTARAMRLALPADGAGTEVQDKKTLTLILVNNHKIKWYNGDNLSTIDETDYSAKGLRAIIQRKKSEIKATFGDSSEPVIIIKPTKDASYGDIVNTLDEMEINKIPTYFLVDADKEERAQIGLN